LRTLRKDTLPRFLTSDLYKDAEAQLAATRPLPKAKSLTVPPPNGCIYSKDTIGSLTDAQRFELNDILADKFLYSHFHHYLMKTIAAENLLCVRMILIFEDIIEKQDYSAARSHAWAIYKYFVAYGSAYEVSLNIRQRKNVMISLAKPTAEMFKDLKSTTMSLLMANFNAYKFTDEYTQLSKRLRDLHAPSSTKLTYPLLCNCIRDQPIVLQ
jgi:Regulator of G protein signaling domain